jgi:integrase
LRHGTASLLLNQNVPVPVVSKYLGHANPGITMKVYAHMKTVHRAWPQTV